LKLFRKKGFFLKRKMVFAFFEFFLKIFCAHFFEKCFLNKLVFEKQNLIFLNKNFLET
jgi:hypothetical protein